MQIFRLFARSCRFLGWPGGPRAAIIHFIMSHCLRVCIVRQGGIWVPARANQESGFMISGPMSDEMLVWGPGPVISVARPTVAKTRRLQNICATHPQHWLESGERGAEEETRRYSCPNFWQNVTMQLRSYIQSVSVHCLIIQIPLLIATVKYLKWKIFIQSV